MYCDDRRSSKLKSRLEHQLGIHIKQHTHEFNQQAEQGNGCILFQINELILNNNLQQNKEAKM